MIISGKRHDYRMQVIKACPALSNHSSISSQQCGDLVFSQWNTACDKGEVTKLKAFLCCSDWRRDQSWSRQHEDCGYLAAYRWVQLTSPLLNHHSFFHSAEIQHFLKKIHISIRRIGKLSLTLTAGREVMAQWLVLLPNSQKIPSSIPPSVFILSSGTSSHSPKMWSWINWRV